MWCRRSAVVAAAAVAAAAVVVAVVARCWLWSAGSCLWCGRGLLFRVWLVPGWWWLRGARCRLVVTGMSLTRLALLSGVWSGLRRRRIRAGSFCWILLLALTAM